MVFKNQNPPKKILGAPLSAVDSFSVVCKGEFYPNIMTLLRILTILPVSTTTDRDIHKC